MVLCDGNDSHSLHTFLDNWSRRYSPPDVAICLRDLQQVSDGDVPPLVVNMNRSGKKNMVYKVPHATASSANIDQLQDDLVLSKDCVDFHC